MSLKNSTVAITGAAGGIGRALCKAFASEGARLALIDRDPSVEDLAQALAAEGVQVAARTLDIADDRAVSAGFSGLMGALGPPTVLINNAGFSFQPTLNQTTPEGWRAHLDGNLNGAWYCTHLVLPGMVEAERGAVVNIGSVNGFAALGDPAYSAAKAGLVAFTRSLAQEYGRYGVRANMVAPGTVRSPIWDERSAKDPEVLRRLERWYPLGRIVEPAEVAEAVRFLASDAASAISGAVLPVDCGLSSGNIVMARELTLEDF